MHRDPCLGHAGVTQVRLAYATTSALSTLTVITWYLLVSAPGPPSGLRVLCLALGAATFWCQLAWLVGYRPARPLEVERINCGVLWHRTRSRAWPDGLPQPGQTITMTPHPNSALMFSLSGLRRPRRAFYVSRLPPSHPAVWAMPRPRADSVLLALLPRDLGEVHVRGDGAVAFVGPARFTVATTVPAPGQRVMTEPQTGAVMPVSSLVRPKTQNNASSIPE